MRWILILCLLAGCSLSSESAPTEVETFPPPEPTVVVPPTAGITTEPTTVIPLTADIPTGPTQLITPTLDLAAELTAKCESLPPPVNEVELVFTNLIQVTENCFIAQPDEQFSVRWANPPETVQSIDFFSNCDDPDAPMMMCTNREQSIMADTNFTALLYAHAEFERLTVTAIAYGTSGEAYDSEPVTVLIDS